MNGLSCYPVQRACVSKKRKVYEYYIPEISLTYLRTHGTGLNGQTKSKPPFGWLCISRNRLGLSFSNETRAGRP